MKSLLIGSAIAGAVVLSGCSSTVEGGKLVLEEEYRPLSRDQVLLGIEECESSGARPVLQRATVKIGGKATAVVIDVTCTPRYGNKTSDFERGYDRAYDRYNDRSRYK